VRQFRGDGARNRVLDAAKHHGTREKELYLVNYKIHLILEKELTDMGKSFSTERAILKGRPFRKHFSMDVCGSASVIAREDRCYCGSETNKRVYVGGTYS